MNKQNAGGSHFFGPLGICSTLYYDYLQSIAPFRDVTLSVFVYAAKTKIYMKIIIVLMQLILKSLYA